MAIWRGVYTDAQAGRGRAVFESRCTGCHGEEARGGSDGPALVGSGFLNNWLEDSVGSLFNKIHMMMPGDAPGTLGPNEAADLTSYVLALNGYPVGMSELEPKLDALMRVRIVGKEGPAPVPNFSMVAVAGCLLHAGSDWTLAKSTEPVRARQPIVDQQVKLQPAGTLTFRLMDAAAANPANYTGQRVLVKGLLMRDAADPKLNVTSIEPAGAGCE
jgi:hypothetical protein